MSRTYRKDEHIKFLDGNPKKLKINHICRCPYCTTDKNDLREKIHKRETKKELEDRIEYLNGLYLRM